MASQEFCIFSEKFHINSRKNAPKQAFRAKIQHIRFFLKFSRFRVKKIAKKFILYVKVGKKMDEFTFKIEEHIAVISEGKGGWKTELNRVSWGDRPAKYDLRPWSADHQKMGKGITFTAEELNSLKSKLNEIEIAQ